MSGLAVVTPPATEPATLIEAKSHLRVEVADDDALITRLITAARQWAEAYTGRAFITTTFDFYLDYLGGSFMLPRSPVQSVASIKHIDSNGVTQTISSDVYLVDLVNGRIAPGYEQAWPITRTVINAATVRFTAGYGDTPESVPAHVRHAILMLVAELYEQRQQSVAQTVNDVPFTVRALLDPERVIAI